MPTSRNGTQHEPAGGNHGAQEAPQVKRRGRKGPSAEQLDRLRDLSRTGATRAEISEALGVSERTVTRWAAWAAGRPRGGAPRPSPARPPLPVPPAAAAGGPVEEPAGTDALSMVRGLVEPLRAAYEAATAAGEDRAAAYVARTIAPMLPVLARLEKQAAESADVLRISMAEIDAARLAYRERVARLLEQPLTCAECGRRLRVAWVEGAEPQAQVQDQGRPETGSR